MFRPAFNSAKRSVLNAAQRQTGRRHNSSIPVQTGDAKWMLGAIAVTVPALGYLLSPPSKKAAAHKAVHNAASSAGLASEKDDDEHPTEIHGPDSRATEASQEQSQTAQSKRDQTASQPSKQAKSDPSSTNGDVYSKQEGLSNTETKHKVKATHVDGENPTAKASATVDPMAARGTEKEGRKNADSAEGQEEKEDVKDDEAPQDDEEPADAEENKEE